MSEHGLSGVCQHVAAMSFLLMGHVGYHIGRKLISQSKNAFCGTLEEMRAQEIVATFSTTQALPSSVIITHVAVG